ncbi:MAG: hypothetical protein R2860_15665 [Desulfobacterales bacterium]
MTRSMDKEKAVESAITQIERQFGKGSIMKLGGKAIVDIPVIPTASLALDKALGIGGFPGAGSRKYSNLPEKPPWPCMWWPKPRSRGALPHLLTRNMR